MAVEKRLKGKGKLGVALAQNVRVTIEGVYEADRQKFLSSMQSLGITFDANNNVLVNDVNDRLDVLETGTSVADLNQTITDPPTQAEVQAISDKIDELLAALRLTGVIS